MRVPLLVNRGMASKIAQTTRKAFEIFSVESVTKDKLQELVQLTAQLTARDINLNLEQVRRERVTRAPVSYMEIFVNKALTVCVFVLWDDTKMPMHNHPDMHGILKVLHGTVRVQSYTEAQLNNNSGERNVVPENCKKASWLWNRDRTLGGDGKEEYVLAKKHEAIFLNAGENEAPAILYPIDGNIHEIQAVDGPAAFLDILAPSYEDGHAIKYFEEILTLSSSNDKSIDGSNKEPFVCLRSVLPSRHFSSEKADYRGPPVVL